MAVVGCGGKVVLTGLLGGVVGAGRGQGHYSVQDPKLLLKLMGVSHVEDGIQFLSVTHENKDMYV